MVELQDCAYDDYFDGGGGIVGAGHLGLGISLKPRFGDAEESATDDDTINSNRAGKNNNSRSRSTKHKRQLSQTRSNPNNQMGSKQTQQVPV